MLNSLLPPPVAVVEVAGIDASRADLRPVEAMHVARAGQYRRIEFAVGRACARSALSAIGAGATAIGVGPHREPLWPTGVVGSITHCAGYCGAAVAFADDIAAVGIDAERNVALPADVARLAVLPRETVGLQWAWRDHWDTVLFSARESVFKAWFPATRRWLGFHDVEIHLDHRAGTFTASPRSSDVDAQFLVRLEGRFACTRSHVFTCAWLPRDDDTVTSKGPG